MLLNFFNAHKLIQTERTHKMIKLIKRSNNHGSLDAEVIQIAKHKKRKIAPVSNAYVAPFVAVFPGVILAS